MKHLNIYPNHVAKFVYQDKKSEQIEAFLKAELEKLNSELLEILDDEKKVLKSLHKRE